MSPQSSNVYVVVNGSNLNWLMKKKGQMKANPIENQKGERE
jgi:hypothetical protein